MNRPTHLPKRQPVGCAALLTAIAAALDLPSLLRAATRPPGR
jgi:hypothetical protein